MKMLSAYGLIVIALTATPTVYAWALYSALSAVGTGSPPFIAAPLNVEFGAYSQTIAISLIVIVAALDLSGTGHRSRSLGSTLACYSKQDELRCAIAKSNTGVLKNSEAKARG